MRRSTMMMAVTALIVGALAATFTMPPLGQQASEKTARLDGTQTETAFLPERFGVSGSEQ